MQCTRRIPQLRPAHLPARCLAGQGSAKNRLKQTMDRHCRRSPPYSPRNLAARVRDYSGRAPASGGRVRPRPARGPGLGEVTTGRSRGWQGSGAGEARAINCQKFTALCLFKPASESEPYPSRQKTRQSSRGKQRGILGRLSAAVADRPDGWRGRAVSPPGGTVPESPAPPGRGHRPACWAPELARNWD